MKKYFFLLSFSLLSSVVFAQTLTQNSGWFMFVNNTKFNQKWGLAFDAQLRSADDWKYLRNVLIRPGLTYYINDKNNATLGYLFTSTHTEEIPIGLGVTFKATLFEHRIFEQYILTHKISSIFATHRLRLEQRFIETQSDEVFAQRFRYFFRLIQPLTKQSGAFTNGPFIALQNETFFNIQNNSKINNSLFDQNRAYLALGYRLSKEVDLEAGYLNQAIHGATRNTINNVAQFAVYTRF